jgi:hypothetical protein
MKTITYVLLLIALIALLASAWPLYAEEPVQALPSVTPATEVTPVEAAPAASTTVVESAKSVPPGLVLDQITSFFGTLQHGEVERAYDVLTKNSKIGDNVSDVATLKAKTVQAIKLFGVIRGDEVTQITPVGSHLARITAISLGAELPLRWRFYYYESAAGWKLIDLRVDDRLVDLFDENPAVPASTPAS